jgi:hypothetical protein
MVVVRKIAELLAAGSMFRQGRVEIFAGSRVEMVVENPAATVAVVAVMVAGSRVEMVVGNPVEMVVESRVAKVAVVVVERARGPGRVRTWSINVA